jgi:CheY-like chemotaxis protein
MMRLHRWSESMQPIDDRLVLVVDDSEDSRALYLKSLRVAGFRALEAEDGLDALTMARKLRPALIVMDLSMPGLDGFAATRMLKRDAETRDICIIALTGHAESFFKDMAFEAGVEMFLTKPCLPEDLLLHINACLAREPPTSPSSRWRTLDEP